MTDNEKKQIIQQLLASGCQIGQINFVNDIPNCTFYGGSTPSAEAGAPSGEQRPGTPADEPVCNSSVAPAEGHDDAPAAGYLAPTPSSLSDLYPLQVPPRPMLPPALDTPKAKCLLQLAQNEGWLDAHYQPVGLKKNQKALLAKRLATQLNIANPWALFSKFWQISHLAQAYQDGIDSAAQKPFYLKLVDVIK